jgi:hypothetical protein
MPETSAPSAPTRDVLSPREVAARSGFSYHAILRAIRRGDLKAFEPVPGHYRVPLDEYDHWLHTPSRRETNTSDSQSHRPRRRNRPGTGSERGSLARLEAIEAGA